ncbi:AAA family ATPase [Vibrio alginolyticus]|nr:AAA family ATPase [Vibrio alginolyticus]
MYINELKIVNYKNFKRSTFKFKKDDVNTIIGENAAGKTNVFQAMRLVLDESLPSNSKHLDKEDFHRGLGHPFGHWIVISVSFKELSESEEEQVLANYILNDSGQPELDDKGIYTFIYRPKFHIRQDLYKLTVEGKTLGKRQEMFESYIKQKQISRETYEAVAFVRTKLDFTNQETYTSHVGDFDKLVFPDPNQESSSELGCYKPPYFSLVKEVACTYVKALRNVVTDLKYYKTNPLYRLLTLKSEQIEDRTDVVNDILNVNEKISSIPEIEALSSDISSSLLSTVGSTYSPKINVSSQLPEDFTELIQSLGLVVEDSLHYQGTGRIEDLSLGGANLIYLALKLYEYEAIRDTEEHITHFLLIEEPEAHIHNHIQKTLFDNFNFKNTQVFVSTHSTQISSASKISAMNILSRKNNHTEVFIPAKGLKEDEVKCIERYLDAIRSDVLFAKSTILVEGDAELILIPAMVKKALGISLEEVGISLVKMDGTVFSHISNLFSPERIQSNCSILTDLDEAFVKEIDDSLSFANIDYIKSQLNAEKSGATRKKRLDAYTKNNPFVRSFYAQNTFETELVKFVDNRKFIENIINKTYTTPAAAKKVVENLNSTNIPLRNFTILKFAEKIGKGWLATKICDQININVQIPDYIIKAIKFAMADSNQVEIFTKMMDYNVSHHQMDKVYIEDFARLSTYEEKCGSYLRTFENDSLCRLIGA